MPDTLVAVKALAENYRTWAAASAADKPINAKRQSGIAETLEAAAKEISEARARLRAVGNAFGDLSDLPPEVIAELNVAKLDELEQQMRDIVAAGGDEVGLDTVIIELYRRHKLIQPRRFVMNKLYRMAQKGLINAIDGKKGVYTTQEEKPKFVPKPKPAYPSGGSFSDDLDDDVPF